MASFDNIPLAKDPSTRLVPWIVGFMVFLATLASAGGLRLTDMADQWREGLTGTITIQVPPLPDDSKEETDARVQAALDVAKRTLGLGEVDVLPEEKMAALLEPWLGSSLDPSALPLPHLLTAEIEDESLLDLEDLRRRLDAAAPEAVVDDHQIWRERMVGLLRLLQLLAWTVVGLVGACAAIMVVFATRGGMATHRDVVEVLHLIGATDSYIAGQFQRHTLRAAIWGGGLGSLAAVGMIAVLLYMASALNQDGGAPALLGWTDWAVLALVPVSTAFIAVVTARVTVIRVLARLV
ncbi:cell division protein FtsX [Aestuariispira ectoiniformans]|uniref:cell division protein FtsX n=1 Tax=Aestuariispira ectoiniformans TaxID=2775080 RepID=UPI00223BF6F2|nr:cell division protein [Aestuariispira ectoiniformans]